MSCNLSLGEHIITVTYFKKNGKPQYLFSSFCLLLWPMCSEDQLKYQLRSKISFCLMPWPFVATKHLVDKSSIWEREREKENYFFLFFFQEISILIRPLLLFRSHKKKMLTLMQVYALLLCWHDGTFDKPAIKSLKQKRHYSWFPRHTRPSKSYIW